MGHDLTKRPDWNRKAIPASLHGDAVPCTSIGKPGTKSYNLYSWAGILGSGSTLQQKIDIFGNFTASEIEEGDHSFGHVVWSRVLWSLHFLYLGIWPTWDHKTKKAFLPGTPEALKAGTPLAYGFLFAFGA